ncbi:DNA processing protein [Mobilisporobacter senegalensis]|uniref:DNA processing protein n=1 Tax=Mobilisporobacter senegalensis TaxID=1329262 RepID=A0A3N1XVV0_9FIRM|nr:DNA-processing protein DprA [Mobilisporobacter senegalensis]ROR30755.1 DNA processing protein [Mobilisporobacter senegalensis]
MLNDEYIHWLNCLPDIGIKKANELLDYYKDARNIYYAKEEELILIPSLTKQNIESILSDKNKESAKISYDKLYKKGIYFVTKDNTAYPEKLKHIFEPPMGLYVKGRFPKTDIKTMAIIGARNYSVYGKEMAKFFAKELGEKGIQVISGLARGIDSFAHQGAIETIGGTFGVLGCGIDICYPRENIELYTRMEQCGGIISEYGLGIPPLPGLFPMRNRIISGLSDGILVIEAKLRSGTFITVDYGLEQGKDIYAIPGRITDISSSGCNNLIKMGAKLVTCVDDIIEEFIANCENLCLDKYCDLSSDLKEELNLNNFLGNKKIYKKLETKEKIVYDMLSLNPKHLEEIILNTDLDMKELIDILVNLQLKDCIKQIGNHYYVLST